MGVMISDARQYIWTEPSLMIWPGLALFICVIAFNWLGDALRDHLDPFAIGALSLMVMQLTIENLSVNSGSKPLVSHLSLTINSGEILALIGASGSGKSITCTASQGVLPHGLTQTSGRLLINGNPIPAEQVRGRYVSTIMQNPRSAFNPVHTMWQHALETLSAAHGSTPSNAKEQVTQQMQNAGLTDVSSVLKLYPHEMSGGMLQRMMIALVMLSNSPFLFADEPTTDLDLVMQASILNLLESLVKSHRLGMLLVTHDMGVVARMAQRVMVMDRGQIVERADISELFTHPKHPITRELISAHLALYGLSLSDLEPTL